MDDGRETSVQSYIFLILICHSIEDYLLNIHQSIIDIISKIVQSFPEGIHQFKRFLYLFQDREGTKFQYTCSKNKRLRVGQKSVIR